MTVRAGLLVVAVAAAVACNVLLMVAAAYAHPCDTRPDDPRCVDYVPPPPPADIECITLISGSNGDRYWNEAVARHGLPASTIGVGGGNTHRWGTPGATGRAGDLHELYWSISAAHPPAECERVDAFWLALSRHNTVAGPDAESEADVIVARFLETHGPDSTLWVTPTQSYDPDTCRAENVAGSAHLVAYALETYPDTVLPLPDVGWPAVIKHTVDGCHPGGDTLATGAAAMAVWAETLGG